MSDTAGSGVTQGSESSNDRDVSGGLTVAAATQLLKASFVPTQAELLATRDGLLAAQDGLVAARGELLAAFRNAAQTWISGGNVTYEEANQYAIALAVNKDDLAEGEQALGKSEQALANGANSSLGGVLDGATVVAGFAQAAYDLYEYAGGTPDTQGPTLLSGTMWNPAGAPEATTQLANVPVQVISVANQAQLIAAINEVNGSPGNYTIKLTSSIVLTGNLPAIEQPTGSVLINGEGNFLNGSNAFSGLVVNGTNATIQNLIVQGFGSPAAAEGGGPAAERVAGGNDPATTFQNFATSLLEGAPIGQGQALVALNGANVVVDNVTFANDYTAAGSGGAGVGQVFADASSSITTAGSSFSGLAATRSQGDGVAVSLSGDEAVTMATAQPGQTTTLNGSLADQGGPGDIDVVVAQGGGTVVLSGTESPSGGIVVATGTTVELASTAAASSGGVDFDSQGTGTLRVDPGVLGQNEILGTRLSGMAAGDSVDLAGLSGATQVSMSGAMATTAGNGQPVTQVTVSNGTQSETLLVQGLTAGASFTTASDGQGGTLLTMTQGAPTSPQGVPAPTQGMSTPTPPGVSGETSQGGVVTFTGTAQAGSAVTLYQLQSGTGIMLQLGTATAGADGQFTLTPEIQPDAGAGFVAAAVNGTFLPQTLSLPAGVGGTAPVMPPGMAAPAPGSIVVRVGTEAQLAAAISEANTNTSQTPLAIQFTNNISLSGTADLPTLQDGSSVQIVGNGYTLQGDGETRGLMLFGAQATIDNLTISDMVAEGGGGGLGASGGGGGAGLGGGLMVAGQSAVTLDDVNFTNDRAVGGAGGESGGTGAGYGGGGGLGGAGGSAVQGTSVEISGGGGGIGNQATGGGDGTTASAGIVAGAPSDHGSGAAGGIDGGGGAGGSATAGVLGTGDATLDGGGGGIYGLSGADTSNGGDGSTGGWGGGGGGNAAFGGNGGFGGGGGGTSNQGGQGGFGGGGGGGAPLRSSTGTTGGFGGGAGGSGTNNTADDGGGGGLGAGGAVFVEQGSSITVENSSSSGDSVAGGQGQSGGQDGQAYGSGWFFQGNQTAVFESQAGQTTAIGDAIADEAGSQSGVTGSVSVMIEGQGTVALDAWNTYSGGTLIDGGNLEVGATHAAGSGNITFEQGTTGTLKIDPAVTQLANAIAGFSQGDSIDLAGVAWSAGTSAQVAGTVTTPAGTSVTEVRISGPDGKQVQLLFQGLPSNSSFVTSSDGQGGTTLTLGPASTTAATNGAGSSTTTGLGTAGNASGAPQTGNDHGATTSAPAGSAAETSAFASRGAAGNAGNLGGDDARTLLSHALAQGVPAPAPMPDLHGNGSGAAGTEPTPQSALVVVPGTEENHAIVPADHGGQGGEFGHHTR